MELASYLQMIQEANDENALLDALELNIEICERNIATETARIKLLQTKIDALSISG